MSVESELTTYLVGNLLWPNQAEEVVALVKKAPGFETIRWSDREDGYPQQLRAAIRFCADKCAREYLEKHHPDHAARMMFDPSFTPPGFEQGAA